MGQTCPEGKETYITSLLSDQPLCRRIKYGMFAQQMGYLGSRQLTNVQFELYLYKLDELLNIGRVSQENLFMRQKNKKGLQFRFLWSWGDSRIGNDQR